MKVTNAGLFFWLTRVCRGAVYIVLILMLVNLLLVDYYRIPTGSMENALLPGDRVLISKAAYGPRLDINAFLLFSNKSYVFGKLPGFADPEKGAIIVFEGNGKRKETLIKRCVASPGDTLVIRKGILSVNGIKPPYPAIYEYRVDFRDRKIMETTISTLNLSSDQFFYNPSEKKFHVFVHDQLSQQLRALPNCKSVSLVISNKKIGQGNVLQSKAGFWTRDDFGPLIIPKRGQAIQLSSGLSSSIEQLISGEGHTVIRTPSGLLIDGKVLTRYSFDKDYYFMLGDNRDNSLDSRWFGPVSADKIIGKAALILFSKNANTEQNRPDRYLKFIK